MRGAHWLMPGILGLLMLLPAFGLVGGTLWVTSKPNFSSKCHEMRPEYYTWQASEHRQVSCVTCHIKPGLRSFVQHKVQALNQIYRHMTGTYARPIHWPEPDSSPCLLCHTPAVERTGSRDLHSAHGVHVQAGVACLECHRGVAHGTIAERRQTTDGDFGRWNIDLARQQMVRANRVSGERKCLDCHNQKRVVGGCGSCHTGPVHPRDHRSAAWTAREHGPAARRRLQACSDCHSATLSPVKVDAGNPVAVYGRSNVFCFACHAKRPPGHSPGWRRRHGPAAAQDTVGCLVCHNRGRPLARDRAAPTHCRQCHAAG